ncbi:MAG: HAMP domain-containing protein [Gammaproteobacteria bacterium]|nr:HAMP domain-containing protein [Gammaproteobacteria bacterium]
MKIWSQSLAGRTLVLVVATVLLCETATLVIFGYYRRGFVVQNSARAIVGYARLFQAALDATPESQRQRLLATAGNQEGIHVVTSPETMVGLQEPVWPLLRRVAERVRVELGARTQVLVRRRSPLTLWVSLRAVDKDWWLAFPLARLEVPLPWGLMGLLMAIISIALGLTSLFVLGILRPLRELGAAARALGAGSPRPAQPGGPNELRHLAEGFNTMLQQLQNNERERQVMLAGLPHDLKAPLARLRLRLEMVDDAELREGLLRDAEDIQHISRQFQNYLHGLGQSSITPIPVNLSQLLERHVQCHRQLGRNISLSSPLSVWVDGDPEALDRLLDNLLENAFRYGAEPVEIRLGSMGRQVSFSLRDHGSGIAREHRQRALEPFSQLDGARGSSGNCGLGLAIAERLVRLHKGQLELDEAAGGGLLVRITLPACQQDKKTPRAKVEVGS